MRSLAAIRFSDSAPVPGAPRTLPRVRFWLQVGRRVPGHGSYLGFCDLCVLWRLLGSRIPLPFPALLEPALLKLLSSIFGNNPSQCVNVAIGQFGSMIVQLLPRIPKRTN